MRVPGVPGGTASPPKSKCDYWVYRRDVTFGHEQFSRFHQPFDTTTATLSDLNDGNRYEFKVTAVGDGGEGAASAVVTATAKVSPPGAPTGLAAEASSGTVKLTWTPPVGAQMYWVYQRDITAVRRARVRRAARFRRRPNRPSPPR